VGGQSLLKWNQIGKTPGKGKVALKVKRGVAQRICKYMRRGTLKGLSEPRGGKPSGSTRVNEKEDISQIEL